MTNGETGAAKSGAAGPDKPAGSGLSGQIIAGVSTAVVLGALGLLWNWGSQGGLVRALGGATLEDVQEYIKRSGPGATTSLPTALSVKMSNKTHRVGNPGQQTTVVAVSCGNDTPVSGACIVLEGDGQLQSMGVPFLVNSNTFQCVYSGTSTSFRANAFAFCADRQHIQMVRQQ